MALSRKCVKIRVQVKINTGYTQVLVMPSLIICEHQTYYLGFALLRCLMKQSSNGFGTIVERFELPPITNHHYCSPASPTSLSLATRCFQGASHCCISAGSATFRSASLVASPLLAVHWQVWKYTRDRRISCS